MARRILIVGGVAGGATAAARLRRLSETDEITLFERGEYISFANCGLPYYIGEVIKKRSNLLVQTVEGMSKRFNLDIRIFSEVVGINKENNEITVKNIKTGEEYTEKYDKLILSPGASPIKPPIPGLDSANNVFTLRNIPDTDEVYEYIKNNNVKHATVIGGGFIGIEMAENLRERDIDVTLIDKSNQVMNVADFEMAQLLHNEMKKHGVKLVLSDGVDSFKDNGKVVVTEKGEEIKTDMIMLAIGVSPETQLAIDADLTIGETRGIKVDDNLLTSDKDIYAIGDAIEVTNAVTGKPTRIPLAWPANRQGRLVADHINGLNAKYTGTLGTSVAKVFDYTVATTGLNGKQLENSGIDYKSVHAIRNNHAGYYPNASSIYFKIFFENKTGRILGAQAIGRDGVEKRIDVIATAIFGNLTVDRLPELELSYAPPFGSAKDPVNILGYIATNINEGVYDVVHWNEIDEIVNNGGFLLDVRSKREFERGNINGSVNINIDELRNHLDELPKDQPIYITCQVGFRGYLAVRILQENGFKDVYNLSGGYSIYSIGNKEIV